MSAEIETMAYAGANGKPWHGLGEDVTGNLTPVEMLQKAGLDWHVSKRLVRMRVNPSSDVEMVIPGYNAIVRDTDNKVFQVASDRYKPIQNAQVLQFFEDYTRAGGMMLETAGALKGGSVIWGLAKLGAHFTLSGGDKVDGYLLLCNSHDGSLSFNAIFTSIRVVCWNTLSSALSQGSKAGMFRMKHSKAFTDDVAKDARKKLGLAVQELRALQEASAFLAAHKVDSQGQLVREYIIRLTNPSLLEDVAETTNRDMAISGPIPMANLLENMISQKDTDTKVEKVSRGYITDEHLGRVGRAIMDSIISSPGSELPSAHDTWWGVVNGVTHYADHGGARGERNADTALASSWFGQKAVMKQDALEMALQYVEKGGVN